MTSTSSTSAERWKSSTSSDAKAVVCASNAPAVPAIAADSVYTVASLRLTSMPIAAARVRLSRIALSE